MCIKPVLSAELKRGARTIIDLPHCRGGSRGRVQGVRTPLPLPEMTCGFLIQLVFCKKKKTMWFIGVEIEQETSAPPPEINPGSAPALALQSEHLHEVRCLKRALQLLKA